MQVAQLTYNLNREPNDSGLPATFYAGWFYSGADSSDIVERKHQAGQLWILP
jgi:hypothetical protein